MLCPIAAGQVRVGYSGAGIGGVDELTIACIDANVRNAAGVCIGKEHNVAGFQAALGHRGAHLILIGRCPVRGIAKLLQDIVDKTRAVKAGGGSSAENIRCSKIFLRFFQNLAACNTNGRSIVGSGRISGGSAAGIALKSCGVGGNAGRLAATEELGAVGGILILVGNLGQVQKIAADIADGGIVNHLVPTFVQTQNIALAAFGSSTNTAVGGTGTGTKIDAGPIDIAITKFSVFTGQYIQIFGMHIAFLKIVVNLIPVTGFADDNDAVILGSSIHNFGICGGITAQPQIISGNESDAMHDIAGGRSGNRKAADEENQCQHKGYQSSGNIHNLPPMWGISGGERESIPGSLYIKLVFFRAILNANVIRL